MGKKLLITQIFHKLTFPTEFTYVDIFKKYIYRDGAEKVKKVATRQLRFDTITETYYYKYNNEYINY
jgi:hypothetical protein